jgi:LysR family transcriptional regulator for bpeEF and oprC
VNYFSHRTGKIYDWDFSRGDERIEIPMPGDLALNDSNAVISAGIAGLGVVQLTEVMLAPFLEDGRLVQVLPDWTTDPLPLHVVYPQNRHLSAKVRVFVEWIAELFANHPGMQQLKPPSRRPTDLEAA